MLILFIYHTPRGDVRTLAVVEYAKCVTDKSHLRTNLIVARDNDIHATASENSTYMSSVDVRLRRRRGVEAICEIVASNYFALLAAALYTM